VFRGTKALEGEVHDHENFDRPAVILDPDRIHKHVKQDIAKLVRRRIPFRMHISYNENITPVLDAMEKMCPSSNDLRLFGLRKNGVSGSICGLI
jgi:hypothetical protein